MSDSVLRPLPGCPKGLEVKIYPGAHLHDMDRVLQTAHFQALQHLQCIIVYAGVTHRDDTNMETVKTKIRDILGHGFRLKVRIYFYQIPIPTSMDCGLQHQLIRINEVIRHASDGYYCPALPPYMARQFPRSPSSIHLSEDTTQWIVRSMAVHLEDVAAIISGRAAARL